MTSRTWAKLPSITTQPPGADPEDSELRDALKHSAAALKADGVPFALGGGYALWVHGAPEPGHDVAVGGAAAAGRAAATSGGGGGFRVERPPEDWLFKAWWGESLVDVLHKLRGITVVPELVASATETEVLGLRMPVLPPTPIMVAKLHSLAENYSDFGALLPAFRAVREQLDWPLLTGEVAGRPFAEAFLFLLRRLDIAPPEA